MADKNQIITGEPEQLVPKKDWKDKMKKACFYEKLEFVGLSKYCRTKPSGNDIYTSWPPVWVPQGKLKWLVDYGSSPMSLDKYQ